jgi:cyanate permease
VWALGPVAVGLAFDRFGSYTVPFWALVGISVVATAAILVAERQALAAGANAKDDVMRVLS